MLRTLRVQVLWAPIFTLVVGSLLVIVEAGGHRRMAGRVRAVTALRQKLDRVLLRLSDRHARTVRRTREALLEPRPRALLKGSSEHYLDAMERHLSDAHDAVRTITVPDGHPRLETDLAHLDRQLERIAEKTGDVAPALDNLFAAVSSEVDTEMAAVALLTAKREFARADKEMESALRVAQRMAYRAATLQAEHAATSLAPVPRGVWISFLMWVPCALFLAFWPMRRFARFSAGQASPSTLEEKRLAARLDELASDHDRLEQTLGDRTREAERFQANSRRAEQELALLRLYNENLVNSLRSAIVVTDASFVITGYNRAARKLLALEQSQIGTDVNGHPLVAALARRSRDATAEISRAMEEREMLRFDGLTYAGPGGEVLLDLTVAPYLDESGAARGLLWVADDVTDAVRVKKQLLAAERLAAVGSLSAQVAHEVRNPLSAIGLNAELLEEEFATGLEQPRQEEAASLLRAIASEIERLTQITEGYLELTRLPRPELRDVDLNQVVGELFSMLNEELKAHSVAVDLELAAPPPRAWADPGQLRQALLNVVRNSREAMPDGGNLHVRTAHEGSHSLIAISDSGPGIPASLVPRVFEPFYTTKRDGTGLGLSLTQQIANEHGGNVTVESRPPEGTTITLNLPTQT